MANVTITAASVAVTSTTQWATTTANATITAGQALYADSTNSNKLALAQADTAAHAACIGVALCGAAAGQPVAYAYAGDVTYNSAFALGTVYVVSATAGAIAPSADLDVSSATNFGTVIGIASSATNLKLCLMPSGALNP